MLFNIRLPRRHTTCVLSKEEARKERRGAATPAQQQPALSSDKNVELCSSILDGVVA